MREGPAFRWTLVKRYNLARPGTRRLLPSPAQVDHCPRIESILRRERTITLQPVESEPRWFRGYLLATTVLFFGLGIFGFIVTIGSDDSIAGRIISGAVSVGFFYFGVRRLRLLRVHRALATTGQSRSDESVQFTPAGGPPVGDTASMEFRRAVRVSGLVFAVMATGCTASSPATRSTEVYMVYQDLAGWSAEIPPGWEVLPFDTSKGNASAVGTQISNVELPAPEIDPGLPIQTNGLVLPPDGVSLIIATDTDPKNVQIPPESPPAPPLSMEDFAQGSATGGGPTFSFLWFEVSGNLLLASIKAGPQADEATLRTLVESIRETP